MNIVLVGAGGSGMSNIAHILWDLGFHNLVAIDSAESQTLDGLKNKNISVIVGHGKYQIQQDDILIYSEAARHSPEVEMAFDLKRKYQLPLKIWSYFQFLGELSKYFSTIGFAGTNGKSSSTGIAIFTAKHLLPDFALGVVGALIPDFGLQGYYLAEDKKSEVAQIINFIITGKKLPYELIKKYYFFVEACEYQRHFLFLDLDYLLITNLELDHTDYYQDFEDYLSAFEALIYKVHKKVFILQGQKYLDDHNPKIEKVAIKKVSLKYLRGEHTNQNVSLVIQLLKQLDPLLTDQLTLEKINNFKGIWRRLEFLGTSASGAKIFSDYGHVASSLSLVYYTLKEKFPNQKITAVFQPHQAKRMLIGREDFHHSLELFDEKVIYKPYTAREKIEDFLEESILKKHQLSSFEDLGRFFAQSNQAHYLEHIDELKVFLSSRDSDEIVVIFTAGDLDFSLRALMKKEGFSLS